MDEKTASQIKRLFPSASLKGGVCEVRIAEESPADIAKRVKELLELVRTGTDKPESL
ncbi:MAG TPA: hypothetical protein VKF15_01995 [Nitrososphaerales archaeon]|nr:hypothetical protein [Nitrososphaerales archaeon]